MGTENDGRPWREAAEACYHRLNMEWNSAPPQAHLVAIIESAIEKAVEKANRICAHTLTDMYKLKKERDRLRMAIRNLLEAIELLNDSLQKNPADRVFMNVAVPSGLLERAIAILDAQEDTLKTEETPDAGGV